jgi:hypothetical protein
MGVFMFWLRVLLITLKSLLFKENILTLESNIENVRKSNIGMLNRVLDFFDVWKGTSTSWISFLWAVAYFLVAWTSHL